MVNKYFTHSYYLDTYIKEYDGEDTGPTVYVLASDYAALESERDRWRADAEAECASNVELRQALFDAREERDELKRQLSRVRAVLADVAWQEPQPEQPSFERGYNLAMSQIHRAMEGE